MQENVGQSLTLHNGCVPTNKGQNIKQVSTLEFVIMVETRSPEFQNEDVIRHYDDWEETVKWVNSLSKSRLVGVCNGMLLVLKN